MSFAVRLPSLPVVRVKKWTEQSVLTFPLASHTKSHRHTSHTTSYFSGKADCANMVGLPHFSCRADTPVRFYSVQASTLISIDRRLKAAHVGQLDNVIDRSKV